MQKKSETTKKPPNRFTKGNSIGKQFNKDHQPPPDKKSEGWKKWREERHLTRTIIKELQGETKMLDFVKKMIVLAKSGNPKAIDVITKSLEETEPIKLDIQNLKILNIDPLDQ